MRNLGTRIGKFVSNIPGFSESSLQCRCPYKHFPSFAGKRNQDGKFISSDTAQYPRRLVDRIIKFFNFTTMSSANKSFQDMHSLLDTLPDREHLYVWHIFQMVAVWLPQHSGHCLSLQMSFFFYGKSWKHFATIEICIRWFTSHIHSKINDSPFSTDIQNEIDTIFKDFFQSYGVNPSFDIPPDQPFRLHAFYALAKLAGDPDAELLKSLITGVDLGISNVIEPSGVWPLKQEEQDLGSNEFWSFENNWKSAETDEDTLEKLIQKEIDDGFVTELDSLESAKTKFGDLLAIGKLGICNSTSR